MAATFPGGVKTFTTKQPDGEILSAHVNDLQDEVVAVENFLLTKANASTIFKMIYPVGSIYISTASTNPDTLFGGTWAEYGQGKMLVGKAASGTFATAGSTGGAETHSHGLSAGYAKASMSTDGWLGVARKTVTAWAMTHKIAGTVTTDTNTTSVATELGGTTDNGSNLQPYVVVYMWQRTA